MGEVITFPPFHRDPYIANMRQSFILAESGRTRERIFFEVLSETEEARVRRSRLERRLDRIVRIVEELNDAIDDQAD